MFRYTCVYQKPDPSVLPHWNRLSLQDDRVARADVDPLHQRPMILSMAKAYLGPSGDPLNPLASPLYGDLEGLPPLLIQCGDCETILDDSVRLANRAAKAGVAVEREIYPSMIHVFQAFDECRPAGVRERRSISRSIFYGTGQAARRRPQQHAGLRVNAADKR